MSGQAILNATIVDQATPTPNNSMIQLALFNPNGTKKVLPTVMAAQADSVAANIAAMVVDHNALLAKLRSTGHMATS